MCLKYEYLLIVSLLSRSDYNYKHSLTFGDPSMGISYQLDFAIGDTKNLIYFKKLSSRDSIENQVTIKSFLTIG